MEETERSAQSKRVTVVDWKVVHGILAVVGIVVTSQQTIKLGVDEQVVVQSTDPGLWRACRSSTHRTTDAPLPSTARVRFQARHAETVAALQDFRTDPEPVVTQTTRKKLLVDLLRLVFTAVELFQHVRIYYRRVQRHFSLFCRKNRSNLISRNDVSRYIIIIACDDTTNDVNALTEQPIAFHLPVY